MPGATLYKKILQFLLEIIDRNGNIPDFKLPSERMLAIKFNASRRPVRLAYEKLIEDGYVENVHGKGYFIKKKTAGEPIAKNSRRDTKIYFITPSLKTSFMQDILAGITRFCDERFIDLSVKTSDGQSSKEKRLLQSAPPSGADGVILFPNDNEYYNDELLKLSLGKYPIAIIDRYLQHLNVSFVATDNYTAMVDVVRFLHQHNYKNFVYITPPKSIATATEERINGFNHGLFKYYGVARADNLLMITNDLEAQVKKVTKYLQKFPDTEVIVTMGVQTTAVIIATAKLGIRIPQDLKLMIFDDELSRTEKDTYKPYIIEQDGYNMGYLAAEALYNQIYGDMRITVKKLPIKISSFGETES